jgi:uncharacterized alkaline shock family protein YloU
VSEPEHGPGETGAVRGGSTLTMATRALQDQPEPGWPEIADRLGRRLRSVSRPGRPLTVHRDGAASLRVDRRVVVDAVRRAIDPVPACRPVAVTVATEQDRVSSVQVEVWARYGSDVHQVAAAARAAVAAVLIGVLGAPCPVHVAVVDVEAD